MAKYTSQIGLLGMWCLSPLPACNEAPPPVPIDVRPSACTGMGAGITCVGTAAYVCNKNETVSSVSDCATEGRVCVSGEGCLTCFPRGLACDGETLVRCNEDGSTYTAEATCNTAAGQHCSTGGCANLCAAAEAARSYLGCEYWATATVNASLAPEFEMAVVIANPQLVSATIQIDRGGASVASAIVGPGQLETVTLPWVAALRETRDASIRVADGAYHITSDVPVTVYQFNPLEYRLDYDCALEPPGEPAGDGECYSYTNDASLLLPTHVLSGSYFGIARPSQRIAINGSPTGGSGFVAIVAAADDVQVELHSPAYVVGSDDGTVADMVPGDTQTIALGRGDVLQILSAVPMGTGTCPDATDSELIETVTVDYCSGGREYDLTGLEIRATGRVEVIGGHDCTFVPFNRWACDHLEETLFPVESWGKDVVIAGTKPLRNEPNLVRVISAEDGNTISFDPPVRETASLLRGEFVEFELDGDVHIVATKPIAVAQFLVGQDYFGLGSSGSGRQSGDPSMALAIPAEQFRSNYTFLAPSTYPTNFVNVIAMSGVQIALDNDVVTGFRPIGASGLSSARVAIDDGIHTITSRSTFGVLVYGFGTYTSYLYPGGLDFRELNGPL